MQNYIQPGENLTLLAPYALTAGQGALVGSIFGVAQDAAASGAAVVLTTEGVYDLTKASGQAWTQGVKLYWDNAAKNVTTTSAGNQLIGGAYVAALSADVIGRVYLDGCIR